MSNMSLSQQQIQSQVKAFLQSSAFPVLQPLKWNDAIQIFLDNQKPEKDESTTKLMKAALVKQIELDLIHNITNGSIEDYWLVTKSDLNPTPKPHLVSLEIEKVAWEEYNEQQKILAEQKKANDDHDDDEENNAKGEAPKAIVSPTKEREEEEAAEAKEAGTVVARLQHQPKKKKKTLQIKKDEEWRARHLDHQRDDALRPFRIQYESAISKFCETFLKTYYESTFGQVELGNFCQYSARDFNPPYRALTDAEEAAAAAKSDESTSANYRRNERLGNVIHWLYLPNYFMDQDEDLVIDVWPCLRELRHVALEHPDTVLEKEATVFETMGHQIRDSFCGHMQQFVDKPWRVIYNATVATFGPLVNPVYRTWKIIEHLRREHHRKNGREEQFLKELKEAEEGHQGAVANVFFCKTMIKMFNKCDPDRFNNATLKSEKYCAGSSTTTADHDDDDDNNTERTARSVDEEGDKNESPTINLTPSAIAEIERQQKESEEREEGSSSKYSPKNNSSNNKNDVQQEDKKSTTSTANSKPHDDDIHSATSHVTIASEMGKISRAEELKKIREMNYLTTEDVVDIVWLMGRCSGANKNDVRKAINDYPDGIVPPVDKTTNVVITAEDNKKTAATSSEKVPYFEVRSGVHLPFPVVVFKDPTFGFMMRSSTLVEDFTPGWCVVQ